MTSAWPKLNAFFLNRGRKRLLVLLLLLLVGAGTGLAVLWAKVQDPLPSVLSWPVSPVLLDKDGSLIHARLSANQEWCLPIPLAEMGHWAPAVLVAVEDKRFFSHPGVDVLALARAVWQNAASGRVRSGASTISSQLVRIAVPRERNFRAKAVEFIGALKLERRLGKEEILEYYLNRAPFGGPIRGIEAAARLYFGKRAKDLSLGEASLLIGLLKGPTAFRPDRNPGAALRRRQTIIRQVAARTGMAEDIAALALAEPLPVFRPVMPTGAWHFANLAFKALPEEGGVVRSSLDSRLQARLQAVLEGRLSLAWDDVTAAGMIVDNATAAIVAYVGNARFVPGRDRHWVDCALAPRSPGSSLKPFVYLAAMEEGRITPASLLADTPLRLGGEAPRNFDRRYRGPVSASVALAESLNAPAVRVLRMVGVRGALARLRAAGFAHLDRDVEDYGDSLVLGAGEVSALELARAYCALANLGLDRALRVERPLAFTPAAYRDTSATEGKAPALQVSPRRVHSAAASWLIAEMLKDTGRLPFFTQVAADRDLAPVAFKTGTSYGLRDAWTAAYTPRHTVVLWFGREDGGPDPALLGISLAAPAAIAILREADAAARSDTTVAASEAVWFPMPAGVGSARVCTLSGAAVSPYCPASRITHDIESVRRTETCTLHRRRDGQTVLLWPPELEDFSRRRLAGPDLSRPARITSPLPGARYILPPGGRHPIALKAEGVAYPVHWYVNGEYLGVQQSHDQPLAWQPSGGEHSLSLLDAEDRVSGMTLIAVDLAAQAEEPIPLLGE